MIKKPDLKLIAENERRKYLLNTWYKLKKFKMMSTGVESVDMAIYRLYGNWFLLERPIEL